MVELLRPIVLSAAIGRACLLISGSNRGGGSEEEGTLLFCCKRQRVSVAAENLARLIDFDGHVKLGKVQVEMSSGEMISNLQQ